MEEAPGTLSLQLVLSGRALGNPPNLASELWVLLETSELASENQVLLRTFRATVDVRSQGSGEPERAGGVSGGAGRRL